MSIEDFVTQSYLKSLLTYCDDTGNLVWTKRRPGVKAGAIAGSKDPKHGYIRVKIDNRLYLAHRLIWLYKTGCWPVNQIDHIDRNRTNNLFSNLRSVTKKQNLQNKGIYKNSKTQITGVHWHKQHRKFCVAIRITGKTKHIGLYKTIDEAITALTTYKQNEHIISRNDNP